MSRLPRVSQVAAGLAITGLVSGCAASAAPLLAQHPAAPALVAAPAQPRTAIDRLTTVARRRYSTEVHGGVVFGTLHRVARDPQLRAALQSGDLPGARAYVQRQFSAVWYHWHVSRLRVVKGSRVLIDAGVPFVVAPAQMTLRGSGGQSLATLQVSIQDVIGYVRYMHRNYPVDVVVRGQGAAHVRSSLPAATHAQLPARGPVTVGGRRYLVRSFHATALGNEPVTVWILAKG
jgi:hypothetical protein